MYSLDFRMKVLEIKKQDQLSFMNVAKRFGVGVASVFRWSKEPTPKFSRNKPATKIDMEALKRGELRLEDIVEVKESVGRELGEYQGEVLYLKKGKFGLYVEWGKEKRSLKSLENVSGSLG